MFESSPTDHVASQPEEGFVDVGATLEADAQPPELMQPT
jgi:hypothetical protein